MSSGRFSNPHWGQGSISFVPHFRQNFPTSGFSAWHFGHFIFSSRKEKDPNENVYPRTAVCDVRVRAISNSGYFWVSGKLKQKDFQRIRNLLGAFYRCLRETTFHNIHEKVRVFVESLNRDG
jgi:hypothetical protein